MPRTRSAATPPPRRSVSDRSRSVRQLTRRAAPPIKKEARSRKQVVREEEAHEEERVLEPILDSKQQLIQQHAAARAERPRPPFEGFGIVAVVLTCLVIFGAWWFLSGLFPSKQVTLAPVSSLLSVVAPTSTVHFVPLSASSSTTPVSVTSTERRLLLPLTPSTSTKRIP